MFSRMSNLLSKSLNHCIAFIAITWKRVLHVRWLRFQFTAPDMGTNVSTQCCFSLKRSITVRATKHCPCCRVRTDDITRMKGALYLLS